MTLAEQARVTLKGRDLRAAAGWWPQLETPEDVEVAALLVHQAMLERAKKSGRPHARDGVDGWIWEGNRSRIFKELWRGLAEEDRSDPSTLTPGQLAEQKITRLLNARENNVKLKAGGRGKDAEGRVRLTTWWVRAEFREGKSPYRSRQDTYAERRLTAHEAGEDREPFPVTVTRAAQLTGPPSSIKNGRRERLLKVLHKHPGRSLYLEAIGTEAGYDMRSRDERERVGNSLAKIARERPELLVTAQGDGYYGYKVQRPGTPPAEVAPEHFRPRRASPPVPPVPSAPPAAATTRAPDELTFSQLYDRSGEPITIPDANGKARIMLRGSNGSVLLAYEIE